MQDAVLPGVWGQEEVQLLSRRGRTKARCRERLLQRVHQHDGRNLPVNLRPYLREVLPTTDRFHDSPLRHCGTDVLPDIARWRGLHHGQRVLQQHR